jgi:hypothetical protein
MKLLEQRQDEVEPTDVRGLVQRFRQDLAKFDEDWDSLAVEVGKAARETESRIAGLAPPVVIESNKKHSRQVLVTFRGHRKVLPSKFAEFLLRLGRGEKVWFDAREIDGYGGNEDRPGLREVHPWLAVEIVRDRAEKKKRQLALFEAPRLHNNVQDLREAADGTRSTFKLFSAGDSETTTL